MNPVIIIPICTMLILIGVFSWRGRVFRQRLFNPLDDHPWF